MGKMVATPRSKLPTQKGRGYSCFRMTILVILCHGVWNNLTCEASPPHSGALKSFGQPEGSQWPLDLFSNWESSASMEDLDPGDPYYRRSIRDPSTTTDTTIIQACSNKLRYILTDICDGHFHNPSRRKRPFVMGKRSGFVFGRVRRAVVNECCITPCSMESLQKYCKVGMGKQSSIGTPAETVKTPSEEVIKSPEDTKEEVAPSPTPATTEPALVSIFRFINYMMNRPSSNRKPKGNSPEEKNVGLPQPRIQDRPEFDQTFQSASQNNPIRVGGEEEPTSVLVLPVSERSSQQAADDSTIAINGGDMSPTRSRGHHHHHPPTDPKDNVNPWYGRTQHEHEMGRNAITSTLPPLMLRVGPLRGDFVQRNFVLK